MNMQWVQDQSLQYACVYARLTYFESEHMDMTDDVQYQMIVVQNWVIDIHLPS